MGSVGIKRGERDPQYLLVRCTLSSQKTFNFEEGRLNKMLSKLLLAHTFSGLQIERKTGFVMMG